MLGNLILVAFSSHEYSALNRTMGDQQALDFDSPRDETVVKANKMVKAKTSFTKLEHRIVASLISQIEHGQESFETQ